MNTPLIEKKYFFFLDNPAQKSRFEKLIRKIHLTAILWPHHHIHSFPKEFQAFYKNQKCVFPLEILLDRVYYIGIKIGEIARLDHKELHPILSYYFLNHFQKQLLFFQKQFGKQDKHSIPLVYKGIEKLKRQLDVPTNMRSQKWKQTPEEIILIELQNMANIAANQLQKNKTIESDWDTFRIELYNSEKQITELTKIKYQNQELRLALKKEHRTVSQLEKELHHVTEKILAFHDLDKKSSLFHEYQDLRQEYDILTRKNDALVSKNIELANHLKESSLPSQRYGNKLESILDNIRDRINALLRRQKQTDNNLDSSLLLLSMKKEIIQLTRSRLYLGKALYNLGLLYLRMGDKQQGIQELKAARELGVRDASVNEIIKKIK